MSELVIASARVEGRDRLVDIHVGSGGVERIVPAASDVAGRDAARADAGRDDATRFDAASFDAARFDAAGRVVMGAFVESHLHLDKALLGAPATGGASLSEAIAQTRRRKMLFTREDVRRRALTVLSWALAAGTTAVRAHTEVDPGVGLLGVETIAELAEELAGVLRLEIAVFPQEGIAARPGTLELMREALRLPGSVVGGCPYAEADPVAARRHVDCVLDLAVEFGARADLHLDLADDATDARFTLAGYVARAASQRALQGRVAIGHVTALSALPTDARWRALDALADADITVTTLPATDLYLGGRKDRGHVRRGLAPLRELWAAGVPTALSSNNVRNAFTSTGRADMLDIALLLARTTHATTARDFRTIMDMATAGGARAMGLALGGPAVSVGDRSDLVVLDATDPSAVLIDQPGRAAVISGGRIVHERRTAQAWAPHAKLLEECG